MVIDAEACAAPALAALLRADDSQACRAHETRDGCASYDPGRSVASAAARVLGELFGWQFAREVPAHERAPRVLFDALAPRQAACDPAQGDLRALAPCPEVNQSLGRLVAIVQSADLPRCSHDPQHQRFGLQVQSELVRLIRSDPALRQRAATLRTAAAWAESALEHHWSQRLLSQLHTQQPPETAAAFGSARTQALARALGGFPYTRNYQQLLAAEVALLSRPAPALLLRDADISALAPGARRLFQRERDKLRALAPALAQPLRECTIAVCGCGPLPISGLMLHTFTGANVVLIDRDARCAEAAQLWVRELERLRILEPGAVRVSHAAVEQLARPDSSLACDIVLIASLVDHAAKQQFAQHLRQAEPTQQLPHSLLLRSAQGLCAELAYEAVDTRALSHISLPFCGESVPERQVWPGPAPKSVTTDTSSELLVVAHRDVLNTSELYRRLSLSASEQRELSQLDAIVSQRELLGTL